MSFIKTHWFGLISGVVVFVFMGVFVLVLLSPRQDAQKRGFIPCTHELADRLLNCESDKKISCLFGAILRNTWCDMKVIGQGVANWFDGKQKTPWSNYIFIPEAELSDVFDTETAKEYLKKYAAVNGSDKFEPDEQDYKYFDLVKDKEFLAEIIGQK